jgi:hypothetical protein
MLLNRVWATKIEPSFETERILESRWAEQQRGWP